MIDWSRIAGFDWDEGSLAKSSKKHNVGWTEAEQLFLNDPLILAEDIAHSGREPRYTALGQADDGRRLFCAFTLREGQTRIRVISVRDMSRRERQRYEDEA